MIIIPARLSSTRFPKKVLHPIQGLPMVIKTAQQAAQVDKVVIATDDESILQVAKSHGFETVMTNPHHKSGTDRVNEAAAILGLDEKEIIINVQADEPFIEPEVIQKVKELTHKMRQNEEVMICSAYKKAPVPDSDDPHTVKVVLDGGAFALYFSRSQIPYPKNSLEYIDIHLGIYGYTKKMLERFCSLPIAPLEKIEGLEQLRALYHGYKVAMTQVVSRSIGIDTPADLERLPL